MEAQITFSLPVTLDIVDLEDYGIEGHRKWDDLTETEKNYVKDSLREEITINCRGEHYK